MCPSPPRWTRCREDPRRAREGDRHLARNQNRKHLVVPILFGDDRSSSKGAMTEARPNDAPSWPKQSSRRATEHGHPKVEPHTRGAVAGTRPARPGVQARSRAVQPRTPVLTCRRCAGPSTAFGVPVGTCSRRRRHGAGVHAQVGNLSKVTLFSVIDRMRLAPPSPPNASYPPDILSARDCPLYCILQHATERRTPRPIRARSPRRRGD